MASTSNCNTPGNYALEQKINDSNCKYHTYIHSAGGEAATNHLPGNGLLPAKNARSSLCYNYCDVESQLFGIGTSNLVNPRLPVEPKLRNVQSVSVADRTPVYMPEPWVVQNDQRPSPLN
jgi:hypothetical protein